MRRRTQLLIALGLLVLFGVWHAGTFDHALVNIGLNAQKCARNGFGATFCGKELDEYQARLQRAKEEGEAAKRRLDAQERHIREEDERTQAAIRQKYESSTP